MNEFGGFQVAKRFLERVGFFALAGSLGGVESLIKHPTIMTHAAVPADIVLGVGAAVEDALESRPSHHDAEPDHDHDDFDAFVVELGSAGPGVVGPLLECAGLGVAVEPRVGLTGVDNHEGDSQV